MKYDFDEIIPRRGTNSVKWDLATDERVLPMWVADMDFRAAPPVLDALERRLRHGVFGYTKVPDAYFEAVKGWFGKRHGFRIENEWILPTTGVIPALSVILKALTEPGDKVILQTPVYNCFFAVLERTGRQPLANPLINENGAYRMDFEDLERKAADPQAKLIFLCNPHNPAVRAWTAEELTRLGEICLRHGVTVISDEIHCDLTLDGHRHIPFASLNEEFLRHSVTCTAPSKTFNIAGMKASVAIIPDELLRGIYVSVLERFHLNSINILGITAMEAAYGKCGEWHKELMDHLEGNRDYMEAFVKERMPKAHMDHPEGTYIFWIDFRGYGFNDETLTDFLVNEAKVALDPGTWFGVEGDGFARLNIGTTRAMLKEGLERIADALDKRENGK